MAHRLIPRSAISAIRCILTSFWLLLPVPAFGVVLQQGPREAQAILSNDQWLKPGIVVEKVEEGKGGAAAGLKEGDVLLRWSDGVTRSVFASPMDFLRMNEHQNIFSKPVTIYGSRRGKQCRWRLPARIIGIETRPNFYKPALLSYLRAQQLAREGQTEAAVAQWLTLRESSAIPVPVRTWLFYRGASALSDAKKWEEADRLYQTAIQDLAASDVSAVFLAWGQAATFWQRGDYGSSEARYKDAEAIIRSAGAEETPLSISHLLRIADRASQAGDLDRAEKYAIHAHEIAQEIGASEEVGIQQIGVIAWQRGDLLKAEACFRQLLHSQRFRNFMPVTPWLDLYLVAYSRGDLDEADRYVRKAQTIAVETHLSPMFGVYECRGLIARLRGQRHIAETYFFRALRNAQKSMPGSIYVANQYNHLGVLYETQGDLERAELYTRRALNIAESLGNNKFLLGSIENDLADILRKRGNLISAEQYYRRALANFSEIAPGATHCAEAAGGLAAILRRKGEAIEASSYYEQAVTALDSQFNRLGGGNEVRTGFRAKHGNYYREYIDLLLTQNQPQLAFDVLERSRARSLLETLAAAHVDIREGADPAQLEQERDLQATIKAKSERRISLLSGKHSNAQVKAIEKEISDLTAEYEDVEGQIRSTSPSYAELTQPQPLSTKEIQQRLLDPDTVLLEYSLGEECSHVFSLTPDSLKAFELPKRSKIEQAARRAYQLLTAPNRNSAAATPAQRRARLQAEKGLPQALDELSRMILGPVAAQLGGKRLLIVPDGALHFIPFQALPEPQAVPGSDAPAATPLVVQHEIINLPSASVLALLRQQQMNRPAAPKAVAVLADPVFTKNDPRLLHDGASNHNGASTRSSKIARSHDDLLDSSFSTGILTRSAAELGLTRGERLELPRLRFSRQEANSILAVTPQGSGLKALDFRASRATATSPEFGQYRIVHFATHGLLNSEHPELSGLVLSLVDRKGRSQEGFLELQDIYNLKLHADLVVLSACETGLGKEISGEGLIGMTRGFMYAGASRVVASLWKVSDAATAELMAEFYRSMEKDGMAPAAALRQAQITMWKQKRWSSPYFWAAFQLQGEWK